MTQWRRSPVGQESAGTVLGRKSILELARIYISAAAHSSALEALDRVQNNGWDEDLQLLRAEALLGLGRVMEAEKILGPAVLPVGGSAARDDTVTDWLENGEITSSVPEPKDSPNTPPPAGPVRLPKPLNRRERTAHRRFLLQLKLLHRTARYRQVLDLGRAYFSRRAPVLDVSAAKIASVVAQSMLALKQPAAARAMYEGVLELYNQIRSPEGVADALLGLANTQLLDCHWDEADALYQEARYRYEEMGQSDKALAAQVNLGVLRAKRGDCSGGNMILMQAHNRCRELGERRRLTTVLLGLGLIRMRLGENREARKTLRTALRLAREAASGRSEALACEFLGELFLQEGFLQRARICLDAGLQIALRIAPDGDLHLEILRRQAELAVACGDLESGRALATRAHEMAAEYGDPYEMATAERVLAEADLHEGRLEEALPRLIHARGVLDRLGETFEHARIELLQAYVRARLGELLPQVLRDQVQAVCRPFADEAEAPLMRLGRRILSQTGDPTLSVLARAS
jgi:tetratricopeptide (TPR) repeat protein